MKVADVNPGTRVAAISLWEPWATLMAIGAKKNETRPWPTEHRGALLICAAQRKNNREMRELMQNAAFDDALRHIPLSHGHAVALVDLDQCGTTNSVLRFAASWTWPKLGNDEWAFGNYGPDRFAWITSGLRRLKPFPVQGRPGIFRVTMPEFETL